MALHFLLAVMTLFFSSCEASSGYIDKDQENTVAMLTGAEWLVVYADYGLGNETAFENETNIYSFDKLGKGWTATGSLTDQSIKKDIRYFQWTFTTDNYAVIQTAGNNTDGYWLIQKLTPTEMWLQYSVKDPVLVPTQPKTFYRFKARGRQ